MGHPLEQLLFGVPRRSGDNRLWTRYPQGDAPNIATASGAGVTVLAAAPLATAVGNDDIYPWDSLTPYAYVYPEKTDAGAGTISNPYNVSQAIQIQRASSGHRVILWLPGDATVTGSNPGGAKFPTLSPASGGGPDNLVIHRAQHPGSNDDGLRTRIRRTSGAGTIFGFYQCDYAVWDGFCVDTKAGGAEPGNPQGDAWGEVGQMAAWFAEGCKFIRIYSDHQGANYAGGNRNNLFIDQCSDIEIGDCLFRNISSPPSVASNVTLLMFYNSDSIRVHHCDFEEAPTAIWCKAQSPITNPNSVYAHRYYRNRIRNCGIGIRISSPTQTTLANAVWAYLNQIYACHVGLAVTSFGTGEPKGIILANNTIYNGKRWGNTSEYYGGDTRGFLFAHASSASFASDALIVTRNNAVYGVDECIFTLDDSSQYNNLEWDRNAYNNFNNFWRAGEGGSTYSISTWRAKAPARDPNAVTSAPGFVDIESHDIALGEGSPLLLAGTDYLDLLGQGTSNPINIGAWIGHDDVFGRRVEV